ncbi:MAG: DUF2125 domain-containing protein [Pseudomonadota bacterium]
MTTDRKRVSRFWLYGPFALAGVILAGYYALWRYAAGEMKSAVQDWAVEQERVGLSVSYDKIKASGFPFFLRVHIDNPDLATPDGWRWRTEKLAIDALPYALDRLIFSPVGEQSISTPELGNWRFTAEDFRASIAQDKTRGWIFSMTIRDAEASSRNDRRAMLKSLIYDVFPETTGSTTLTLSLDAADVYASDGQHELSVNRAQTFLLLSETAMLSQTDPLTAWRSAGGALDIRGLGVNINDAELSANGKVSLDSNNHPNGTLSLEVAKPLNIEKPLAATGAMTPEDAEAVAASLTLAAMAGGGKARGTLEFRDGTAFLNGVEVAALPTFSSRQE